MAKTLAVGEAPKISGPESTSPFPDLADILELL
jgi:hypothetical protein